MQRVVDLLAFRDQAVSEHGDEHRARQLSSQFLTTWKEVVGNVLNKDIDVNYISKAIWRTEYSLPHTGPIALQMDETILSTLRRALNPLDPVFSEQVVRLLEAHGAVDSIQTISIGTGDSPIYKPHLHRLTQAQREKLLPIPMEQLFFTALGSLARIQDVGYLSVADQSPATAEELLDILRQEAEHPGSVFERKKSAQPHYLLH